MPNTTDSAKIVRLEEKVKYLEERAHKNEQEILQLKGDMAIWQASTGQVKNKLDLIYNALIGDEIGNVGVVKRLASVESVIEWINGKKSYMWGMVGGVGAVMGFVIWAVEKIFDLLK